MATSDFSVNWGMVGVNSGSAIEGTTRKPPNTRSLSNTKAKRLESIGCLVEHIGFEPSVQLLLERQFIEV